MDEVFVDGAVEDSFEEAAGDLAERFRSLDERQVDVGLAVAAVGDEAFLFHHLEEAENGGVGELALLVQLLMHIGHGLGRFGGPQQLHDALLKLKPQLDAEATVIAHLPGKGRFSGRLGALEVETPDGVRFRLGSGFSDAVRRDPPALGSRVTYRYRSLTPGGVPRFASFLRPRVEF